MLPSMAIERMKALARTGAVKLTLHAKQALIDDAFSDAGPPLRP